jgi:hypothetical protein
MIHLKNINTKYIISTGFGLLGLILSLFVGIFSGNGISAVFFRAFITAIIFSIVGFICLFIIEQFVPEIYQIVNSMNIENANVNVENTESIITDNTENVESNISNDNNENIKIGNIESDDSSISNEILTVKNDDTQLERQFNTIEKQTDNYSSLNTDEKDSSTISRDILKDNRIKYEPKIAAQAIRTMMKRDE